MNRWTQLTLTCRGALYSLPGAPPTPEVLPPRPLAPLSYLTEVADSLDAEALSPTEQASILVRLEQALSSTDDQERDGAQFLTEKFGRRDDLGNDVAQRLTAMGFAAPHSRGNDYSASAESPPTATGSLTVTAGSAASEEQSAIDRPDIEQTRMAKVAS